MIKQKRLACMMRDRLNCGIKSAPLAVSLSSFSITGLHITIVSNSLADSQPESSKFRPDAWQAFDSAVHSPLDKPPPFLS
jgi:hypothetical protein